MFTYVTVHLVDVTFATYIECDGVSVNSLSTDFTSCIVTLINLVRL